MIKWVWTVPNVLSLFRIVLVPVFAVLYLLSGDHFSLLYWSLAVLGISGLTDLLDGKLARKLNQVTDIGKILDPVADKLTQITVVLCLAIRMPRLWPLLIILAVKEILQCIGALILLRRGMKIEGAKWYGKVSTFVFYFAMAMIVIFPPEGKPLLFHWNMPPWLYGLFITLVIACLLFAFVRYTWLYVQLLKQHKVDVIGKDCGEEAK